MGIMHGSPYFKNEIEPPPSHVGTNQAGSFILTSRQPVEKQLTCQAHWLIMLSIVIRHEHYEQQITIHKTITRLPQG
jgi:hypothetical protein